MPITEAVLGLFVTVASMLVTIVTASIGSRRGGQATAVSVLLFALIIPLGFSMCYLELTEYIAVWDWPYTGGRYAAISPLTAIFVGSWFAGLLGLYTGRVWAEDDDRSCLQCTLVPFLLILAGLLVAISLP